MRRFSDTRIPACILRLRDRLPARPSAVRAALSAARARSALTEQIVADRALVIAEIPTENVFGTPPSDAADQWGGVLLRREERSFTVLLAPEPWDLPAVVRELEVFDPLSLSVLESPGVVEIQLDEQHARVWTTVPVGEVERVTHK